MILSISGKIGSGKDTVGSIIQYLVWRESYKNDTTALNFPPISEAHFDLYRNSLAIERSSWNIVKWADKLKDIVCILLGCTREQLEDRVFKETPLGEEWWYYKSTFMNGNSMMYSYLNYNGSTKNKELVCLTPRKLLQLLGTECGIQIIHPNIWVNATMVEYKPNGVPYNNLGDVFDDLKLCPSETKYPDWIITDTRFPNELQAVKERGGISIRLQRDTNNVLVDNLDEFINSKGIIPLKEHPSETALDNTTFDYVIDNNGTIEDLIIKVKEILIKENII